VRTLHRALGQLLSLALVAWQLSACGDGPDGAGEGNGGHSESDGDRIDAEPSDVADAHAGSSDVDDIGTGSSDVDDVGAGSGDGQTSFVSAPGYAAGAPLDSYPDPDSLRVDDSNIPVAGAELYRTLGERRLLNLNHSRGLQVIDYSDLNNLEVIGRLPIAGSPVEVYVVDTVAYVLLNNWQGFFGDGSDIRVDQQQGAGVFAVNLSEPTAPREIARTVFPGSIQTSRIVQQGDSAALYVVVEWSGPWEMADGTLSYDSRTVVTSFDLSEGTLTERSQIDLGEDVRAIQPTPQALLVARSNPSFDEGESDRRSLVSIVDISSVSGNMIESKQAAVVGSVHSHFNMDLYNGVLRVISSGPRGESSTNHLQTFDATDFQTLAELDNATFGDGGQTSASLFLGNKAFVVTASGADPVHTFEITDAGDATETSEFVISANTSFLRAASGETRMIGISTEGTGRLTTVTVSLYDITRLDNPSPLVARSELPTSPSWEASTWNSFGVSVVEDAVEVAAEDGTIETGLILLPFLGWIPSERTQTGGVQIFTFSESTLTRRGYMEHGSLLRRSLPIDEDFTVNVSGQELSLFDTSDPGNPVEQGRLNVAPDFVDIQFMGDHALRVRDRSARYEWSWPRSEAVGAAVVEVLDADAPNLHNAEPIASLEIPSGGKILQSGDLLVSVSQFRERFNDDDPTNDYQTTVSVIDMTDPAAPVLAGTAESTRLQPYQFWGYGNFENCWSCGGRWFGDTSRSIFPTDGAITFLQTQQQRASLGMATQCSSEIEPTQQGCGAEDEVCVTRSGARACDTYPDGSTVCSGGFRECTRTTSADSDAAGEPIHVYSCTPFTPEPSEVIENCREREIVRYWQSFSLVPVLLSGPDGPTFGAPVDLGAEFEGASAIHDGNRIFVTYVEPAGVDGDNRPLVRYLLRILDMTDPAAPVLGPPISIPGHVIAVRGNTIYTRDTVWGPIGIETAIVRLTVNDSRAQVQSLYRLHDRQVHRIAFDGAGHLLVAHEPGWGIPTGGDGVNLHRLSILDEITLEPQAEAVIDHWTSLAGGVEGRAFFHVPGGMLVVNTENATTAFTQGWLPNPWWTSSMSVRDGRLILAAGSFGIVDFDLDEFNLLPAP
jgi:hypothetical protein